MVAFARIILLASTVAAASVQLLGRDTKTVLNDISQKIVPQVATLSEHINGFPASGRDGAEAINKDAKGLIEIIKAATDHVKEAGSFSVSDGISVLAHLQPELPKVLDTLTHIREKASSWDAIEGPKLALEDLEAGKEVFSDYLNAIIAAEPFQIKAGVVAAERQLVAAFDEAIKAYTKS
ncbi:hypothetical protein HDV63DRAFT_4317 [Trichoderma sp. SZMC 28014]